MSSCVEVGELDVGERLELAAEHEVQELLGGPAGGVVRRS